MILIKLFLVINIINFFYRKIFNIKTTTLACGIYGFSGRAGINKADMRLALQKFKILGMYNESRGKDSCGVYLNGEIKKGMGPQKLFTDFIETYPLQITGKNTIMLGHNRQASTGFKVNEENQHPLFIEDDMLITHNGTLKDTAEFCKKYDLDFAKMNVDTMMLGTALYKNDATVLENYKGAAALAITYKTKPNTLYLYHGSSKEYKHSKPVEERPLCYLETKQGVFYSSLEASLEAIKDDDSEIVYMLEHNLLTEICDGQFTGNNIVINRDEINVEIPKVYGKNGYNYSEVHSHLPYPYKRSNLANQLALLEKDKHLAPIITLNREALPKRISGEKDSSYLYYYKGSHMIHNPAGPDYLADGVLLLANKKGYLYPPTELKIDDSDLYYFWEGVMLKDKAAFSSLTDMKDNLACFINNDKANWAECMSRYSKHPVYDYKKKGLGVYKWYEDGHIFNGSLTPIFSGRSYKIINGHLTEIKSSHKTELCYYETSINSENEWNTYLAGGLISVPMVIEDNIVKANKFLQKAKEEQKPKMFYDLVFDNRTQADYKLGLLEKKALDEYSLWFLTNDTPFKPCKKDIEDCTEQMITEAIANGIPIMEYIPTLDGVRYLRDIYNHINLEFEKEIANEDAKDSATSAFMDNTMETDDEDVEDVDCEDLDEHAIEFKETMLESILALQEETSDCVHFQENEEVQALACYAYRSIDHFKDLVSKDSSLNGKEEIIQFIKKLNTHANGVI